MGSIPWRPGQGAHNLRAAAVASRAHVVIAHGGVAQRESLGRILGSRWNVELCASGAEALRVVRAVRPHLVLVDFDTPELGGTALVKALRADDVARAVPVILLSEHSGERGGFEALSAGADVYLPEPYSTRELIAHVEARIEIARLRREIEFGESRRAARPAASPPGMLDLAMAEDERAQATPGDDAVGAQFETLLGEAPLAVVLVDADFKLREVNRVALPTLADIAEPVGRDFTEVVRYAWPEPRASEVLAIFRHTLETGEPYVSPEWGGTRRDRGVREYYEFQTNRVRLPDGRAGVICYYRNLAPVIRARNALANAQTLTSGQKRALELSLSGAPIDDVLEILVDTCRRVSPDEAPATIVIAANGDQPARIGASAGLPESCLVLFKESRVAAYSSSRRVLSTGAAIVIGDVQADPDCEPIRAIAEQYGIRAIWSFPIRGQDETILGALTVCPPSAREPDRDDLENVRLVVQTAGMLLERSHVVAARRAAEQALRRSERRVRGLADAMPQLVWTANPDGSIDYYNARAAGYAAISPGPNEGFEWRAMLHPDDLVTTEAAWGAAAKSRRPFTFEHRLRMRDGRYRWHLSRAQPVVVAGDDPGGVLKWFGTATDVHDLRVAQEALSDNQQRLTEADRRKDEFLAVLAHELRNPLAPIRAGLQLIRLGGDQPETVARVREIMERQVSHMVRLIDDLLDVSRITSGKITLQRQPTLLTDLVQGAIDANRAALDTGDLELRVSLPDEPVVLDVDPTRLVQVLSNLLQNAIKFTQSPGRVELVAWVQATAASSQELVLTVRDNGIGIAPEMLPRLFELFSQAEPSRHRSHGGLGIGLALARQMIEMHGGRIAAASEGHGRGSTFEVRLPVAADASMAALAASPSQRPDDHARRVLIIDDNVDAAESMAMLVRELGGEADTAHDGRHGIERMRLFRPEVVLLDIGMPGMDGYETCRHLRSLGREAYIVALTGWGQDQDRSRALRSGFDAHLTKPADPCQLEQLLVSGRKF